ncbi:hypothetical protein BKA67DRAFT_537353 [Truncatella angustata]|uniref:Uncharacterized protein n=1 Tax=Truncatella angustata TaxID=152316 RepID=A0A9P8ZUU7_9PEZI|nr:uncharacterized protein BKA67DRAFT_537353 [Truncatella angustata]KAH6651481.1 hypothetical protein BKA67DRAFT_537353 [Truncatella angustata]
MALILFHDTQCGHPTQTGIMEPGLKKFYEAEDNVASLYIAEVPICVHGGTPILWAGTSSNEQCAVEKVTNHTLTTHQTIPDMCIPAQSFPGADELQWHWFDSNSICQVLPCGETIVYFKFHCDGAIVSDPEPSSTPTIAHNSARDLGFQLDSQALPLVNTP